MQPPDNAAQSLLDALPWAAILIAPDERVAAVNAQAAELLGGQVAGRHYGVALRQPDLLEAIESCFAGAASVAAPFLTRSAQRDGTFLARCARLSLPGSDGVLVTFEDRSDLEHASQMRRDFVANVSHELRTPLTALSGFIETLRGPARDDVAARERFLGIMQAEAARMERLVSELLSLNRVESQERVRPHDPVDLAALLRSCLHSLAPVAGEHDVTCRAEIAPAVPPVAGDEDQLRQVITNLVENAIKYGAAGGEVVLRLAPAAGLPGQTGGAVRLDVTDFGAGMDPLHIPRLTERFYRVDSHRSREVGGTGLGLAIVKHIVNRHRGRLKVESAPGQGSTFSITLPVAPGDTGAPDKPEMPDMPGMPD